MTKSAFPILEHGGNGLELTDTGMDLRDYFAAKAMEGWLVSDLGCGHDIDEGKCARFAYQIADAMMAERERRGKT